MHVANDSDERDEPDGCFLCDPDGSLVYLDGGSSYVMTGLGPIVPDYSILAPHSHARSMSAADTATRALIVSQLANVRSRLTLRHGRCLVTEHGNVPVCLSVSGGADAHCYHGHFLVFPGVALDLAPFARHYTNAREFPSVEAALTYQHTRLGEYVLASASPESCFIFEQPVTKPPRLLVRRLVAEAVGRPGHADWRQHPEVQAARDSARGLRILVSSEN